MNGKNWYSVYFSSHFKGLNGILCDFSVLLCPFQTTNPKSRQDEEEHILPTLFRQEYTFSQTFEKMPASRSWHPVLQQENRIPTPGSRNPIKDFLQILLSSFFSSSLLLLHITYYFTFGQEPPASITALPFSGAEAPL